MTVAAWPGKACQDLPVQATSKRVIASFRFIHDQEVISPLTVDC